MEVDANLSYENLDSVKSYQVRIYYDYLPQENHATVSHQAIFNAFRGSTRLIHKRIRAVCGPCTERGVRCGAGPACRCTMLMQAVQQRAEGQSRTLAIRPENYSTKGESSTFYPSSP